MITLMMTIPPTIKSQTGGEDPSLEGLTGWACVDELLSSISSSSQFRRWRMGFDVESRPGFVSKTNEITELI